MKITRVSIIFCMMLLSVISVFAGSAKVVRNVVYKESIGAAGVGDLYFPEGYTAQTPVALAIHGGGWGAMDRGSWAGVAEFLCKDLGFVVFNIEYRLVGVKPWPACGNDCVDAANYLLSEKFVKEYGIECRKVWTCGGSAGGHLALWTGLSLPSQKVGGAISVSGIGDLFPDAAAHSGRYSGLFGHKPTDAELKAASPMTLVKSGSPAMFCSHALEDKVVPPASTQNFVDACKSAGVTIDHFTYENRHGGHSIWIPGSKPHKLLPYIEEAISKFVRKTGSN